MKIDTPVLGIAGLQRFQELRPAAINAVAERFCASHGSIYSRFGQKGREACREDLAFHLEFLRPVLEFGIIQPLTDYLRWLAGVLVSRGVPAEHLPLSLDWLAEVFAAGMAGPDGEIVVNALHLAKTRYLEADDTVPAMYGLMPQPWVECEAFEQALLAGDRRGAASLLDGCFERGRNLVDTEMHMIQPALYAIGRKWQNNQVTVAQEHLATAISQSVMTGGLLKSTALAANGKKALLACVEGNNHSVGLQMVADGFQLAGWEVQFLGANVPTGALIQHLGRFKPDLLGLSVSFAQQLRAVREIISRLAQLPGAARPSVIVGGLAINQFSRLADELGADAWSPNAHSAVVAAAALKIQAAPA